MFGLKKDQGDKNANAGVGSNSANPAEDDLPAQLQVSISRNLSDKLYEKRKVGALEVEQLIRDLLNHNEQDKIKAVIQHLVTNFADSNQGTPTRRQTQTHLRLPHTTPHHTRR